MSKPVSALAQARITPFWRNVITVLGSTAAAQLILLLAFPLLTRFVDQAELGEYFYWLSAATVLVVLANARLDMAVFVEGTEEGVIDLLRLLILVAVIVSGAIWLTLLVIGLVDLEGRILTVIEYSGALAVAVFALSVTAGVRAYLVYRREYVRLGLAQGLQSVAIALCLLLVAVLGASAQKLVVAHVFAAVMSLLVTFALAGPSALHIFRKASLARAKEVLLRHYRFPLYSMPADLVNTFANQLPIFIIAGKYGAAAVALYALTARTLAAPVSLLAGSILTVFKEQAATEYRAKGECVSAYRHAFVALLKISVIPFAAAWFVIQPLFVILFGQEWKLAGEIAEILLPLYLLRFISSPLSYTLYIGNWQRFDLAWQIALLAVTWGAFAFSPDLIGAVTAYAIGYGGLYLVYLAMSYRCAKGNAA